tara:strand:+ start:5035 stop:5982 length:948 start_codon:yes stop_codon:yes gene_type:complete
LISIIIPTYNRANLISETLDSILAQTYKYWEAIVVDDRSTDTTDLLLKEYCDKDARIAYYKRPEGYPKGGNVCRNIGLEKKKGDFVVFFDSDDLMEPNHLEVKVTPLLEEGLDFTITKTKYFNKPAHKSDHVYDLDRFPITLENYLAQHINWLTLDICIRTSVLGTIKFHEQLQSGQEFNFYSKLLTRTTKGLFIPETVSLRRYHEASIQFKLSSIKEKRISSFISKWKTYKEIEKELSRREKQTLLINCIKVVIKLKEVPEKQSFNMIVTSLRVFGFRGLYFLGYLAFKPFDKGYIFISQLYKMGMEKTSIDNF